MANINIQPRAFVCTPSSLIESVPCLKCLSEKQLLAVLTGILALALGKTVAEAVDESKCFTCMSKKQMLEGFIIIMGNALLGERATSAQVLELTDCLNCASEKQLMAASLYLLCAGFTFTAQEQLG